MAKTFRDWLAWQEKKGYLKRVKKEVDPLYEAAGIMKHSTDIDGPTILLEKVRGCPGIQCVGNLYYPLKKQFEWFGTSLRECGEWWLKKEKDTLSRDFELRKVTNAPCQEVVWTGEDADVTRIPALVTNQYDPAPYMGTSLGITVDPIDGRVNCGAYRNMIKGPTRIMIDWHHGMHPYIMWMKARKMGKNLPVAFAFGAEPSVLFSTAVNVPPPFPRNELETAAAALGEPLDIVKCKTSDIWVPANCELVIEGEVLKEPQPGEIGESEGPFGEFTDSYGSVRRKWGWEKHGAPVCRVKAITMRKNAIYHQITMPVENDAISYIPSQGSTLRTARAGALAGEVTAAHKPLRGSVILVSLKPHLGTSARNLLVYLLSRIITKTAIVVSDDTDIYNYESILWAIERRVQPDEDVIIINDLAGLKLDPSVREYFFDDFHSSRWPYGVPYVPGQEGVMSKMGIDATAKMKIPFEARTRVFPPPEYRELVKKKWDEYFK